MWLLQDILIVFLLALVAVFSGWLALTAANDLAPGYPTPVVIAVAILIVLVFLFVWPGCGGDLRDTLDRLSGP
jgi:hypothetical protein